MNKGFTLIELLAVIVILAIIALIATPIVLGIIEDTKASSQIRSAEMYLDAVENAVMKENMNNSINFKSASCDINAEGNLECNVKAEPIEIKAEGEKPTGGKITFENGKIKEVILNYESGTIVKDSNGELVLGEDKSICTLASDSEKPAGEYGAKYNCKVDPNKPKYTFYLIDNNDDGTSDLIMNANINSDGEAVIPGVTSNIGIVAWYADERNNINGPVTAMTYLYNATKSWTNVEPLNYSYYDKEFIGISVEEIGYQSFISISGIGVITKGDSVGTQVTIGSETSPLRSRLVMYAHTYSLESGEVYNKDGFIYDNLHNDELSIDLAYWTLSTSNYEGTYRASNVHSQGAGSDYVDNDSYYGVRPVITVKL